MLSAMHYRSDVIERQLAHQERDKVRASYNQAEYLPERREMMNHWADFVDSLAAGKVIPLKEKQPGKAA